jgi:hypothetical protein
MARTTVVVVTGLDINEVRSSGGVPAGVEILGKPVPFARLLSIALDTLQRLGLATQVH